MVLTRQPQAFSQITVHCCRFFSSPAKNFTHWVQTRYQMSTCSWVGIKSGIEKEQAYDIAHGQALVEEFGDFEALYEELQRLRKIAVKYDCIKINGNYPDKISRLKSRIKHLLELQANQDKEIEQLREDLNNYEILAETRGNRLIDSERKNNDIVKVLAPCDYKEVQGLNKILKSVLESNEALAVNINELSRKIEAYQLSEKEAQEIIAELNYKNEQLSQLLKESIRLISYEHEVYEDENFIKEVNEVLK